MKLEGTTNDVKTEKKLTKTIAIVNIKDETNIREIQRSRKGGRREKSNNDNTIIAASKTPKEVDILRGK